MADSEQEKTEQPTGTKLSEAKSKGNVPYSHELHAALSMLAGFALFRFLGDDLLQVMLRIGQIFFQLPIDVYMNRPADFEAMTTLLADLMKVGLPFLAVATLVALSSGFLQIGFHFTTEPLSPDLSKLNPFANFGRLFSLDSVMKIVLSTTKMSIVAAVAWMTMLPLFEELTRLHNLPFLAAAALTMDILMQLGFRTGGALFAIAILDIFFRRWRYTKSLMMTKEEVKDEAKRAEGDPKIKSRIREAQREMTKKRMITDVRTADLVVRNPTHFAVALKYVQGKDPAPRVVAKGADLLALQIIKVAQEAGVEVVENRPLARDLFRSVELGGFVPERLFRAIAALLAVVYKKNRKRIRRSSEATAAQER